MFFVIIHNILCLEEANARSLKLFKSSDENKTNNIFEGDLKLPAELIYRLYDLNSLPGGKESFLMKFEEIGQGRTLQYFREKAATTSAIKLWENHIVWYKLSSKVPQRTKKNIHQAMKYWENKTCLKFRLALNSSDYVYFTSSGSGCFSTYIGKQGGRQIVNIGLNCAVFKHILHEIGHVIGFWHEHTRPDRDNYIIVHTRRIAKINLLNFVKRKRYEVDYQGVSYDYGSIMHYPTNGFSRSGCYNSGCTTLSVNNDEEYQLQGEPKPGHAKELSSRDIQRANHLYRCPGGGVRGLLIIEIKKGHFLLNTNLDTYVLIKGLDSNGTEYIHQTSYRQGNQPLWNEFLILGDNEWQFFRITAWNFQAGNDDQITMSQTIPLKHVFYNSMKHCSHQDCIDYILLNYYLDGNVSKYTMLKFFVSSAYNLIDTDSHWHKPDPYVKIEAIQSDGTTIIQNTRTMRETTNPMWNEWIEFGCDKWNAFFIQVLDEDEGIDDLMSERQVYFVQPGVHMYIKHSAFGEGYLSFDYKLLLESSCGTSNYTN